MKRLIAAAVFSFALGFGNSSFAENSAFGVKITVVENTVETGREVEGSHIETERTDLYESLNGGAYAKSIGAESFTKIKLLPDKTAPHNLEGLKLFVNNNGKGEYDTSDVYSIASEYTTKSFTADEILSKVPSVSSEDEKTIGILVPPFGYFAKKF